MFNEEKCNHLSSAICIISGRSVGSGDKNVSKAQKTGIFFFFCRSSAEQAFCWHDHHGVHRPSFGIFGALQEWVGAGGALM